MKYQLEISGDKLFIDLLLTRFKKEGARALNCNKQDSHSVLMNNAQVSPTKIVIDISSFSNITEHLLSSTLPLSKEFYELDFKLKAMDIDNPLVAGHHIIKGEKLASFEFTNELEISEVIEEYLFAIHSVFSDTKAITVDGVLLSSPFDSYKYSIAGVNFINKRRVIYLVDKRPVFLNLEYIISNKMIESEEGPKNLLELTSVSWKAKVDDISGLLHEVVGDSLASNFFHIVGFKFAIEIAQEKDKIKVQTPSA